MVSIGDAITALERAFSADASAIPDRQHLDIGGGDLLLMPAWSDRAAGVKLVTVAPDNPAAGLPLIHGVYVLFDKPGLRPVALFDAAPLTALRTSAVSALATRQLARPDSTDLVIFGAGVQARAHLAAIHTVLDLRRVGIVSRSEAPAGSLADAARSLGLEAEVTSAQEVTHADVICTCTTSREPLFDGGLLKPGAHVNAVGSYRPDARELDDRTVTRATVVIDTAAALQESGDLVGPVRNGTLRREDVRLLSDVLDGSGRQTPDDITVFKSVGAAFEDLAVAEAAAEHL